MKQRQAGLADVARESGVSTRVVWQVLSGRASRSVFYSEATRLKVVDAAERLGYRPNRAARMLRTKRLGNVALAVRRVASLPPVALQCLCGLIRQRGRYLVIEPVGDSMATSGGFLRERTFDGLLVFEDLAPDIEQAIEQSQLPVVRINTRHVGHPSSVNFDERDGVRKALQHAVDRGRRRPAYLTCETLHPHVSVSERRAAFVGVAGEMGLDAVVHTLPQPHDAGALADFLRASPGVDVLLCYSDVLCGAAYRAARAAGRAIPRDLAVVTFNRTDVALSLDPPVTCLWVEMQDAARIVMDMLERLIEGEPPAGPVRLPYRMDVLEST